jgi:hypothetical protein
MGKIEKSKTSKKFWKIGINERNATGNVGNWAQVTKDNQKTFDVLKLIDEDEFNEQIRNTEIRDGEYIELHLNVNVVVKKLEE